MAVDKNGQTPNQRGLMGADNSVANKRQVMAANVGSHFPSIAATLWHIFRSPLKLISVTPDPRSDPRSATSRLASAPVSAHRSGLAHKVFSLLRSGSGSAPAPMFQEANQCVSQKVKWYLTDCSKNNAIFNPRMHASVRL